MELKKHLFVNCISIIIFFSCFIAPLFADFQLGDSKLPIDEEGFIVYEQEWEEELASGLALVEVKFVDIYRFYAVISGIGVNITVSEKNSTSNTFEILKVDNLPYQNVTCLLYNKTHQYFIYSQFMNNLLLAGYGGYFVIPNDPVDVNIVKVFVESYLGWAANVIENTITIDIANAQVILTYNEHGILSKEEIKNNNETISILTLIEKEDEGDLGLVIIISLIIIISVASVVTPTVIIFVKKSRK